MPTQMTPIQALSHFRSNNPHAVQMLADFCGSSRDTVLRWNEKRQPKGVFLLRLEEFLRAFDYKLNTPASKHEVVRYMATLVAFRLVSTQEALQYFDVKQGGDSYLWQVLRGSISPYYVKAAKISVSELADVYDAELAKKRRELADSFRALAPPRVKAISPNRQPRQPTDIRQEAPNKSSPEQPPASPFVTMAAGAVLNCLPYLKALDIPNHPEVGAQMRSLIGSDNYFDILDMLKSMSSREAGRYFSSSQAH